MKCIVRIGVPLIWISIIYVTSILYWRTVVYEGMSPLPEIIRWIVPSMRDADGESSYNIILYDFWIWAVALHMIVGFITLIHHVCRKSNLKRTIKANGPVSHAQSL